jgi:hypothetical protein|tara:strand:+ start:107 stop:451 length:345 start_codon:yes stop_codon:yes gene_type:complete
MTNKTKQTDLSDILGKQQDSESEGSIQEICGFDKEINIVDGIVKEGKYGKYVVITVQNKDGEHKVHSSSNPIIETIESLIQSDSFKDNFSIACKVKKGISSNDRTFYSLVGLKE